jgi:glycerophosphoryl diester phosphodiesterase
MTPINKFVVVTTFTLSYILTHAQTKIIAHRGVSNIAPENTLIAFQKAIEFKADYFELDVHKTKDDSIVVIHDSSVDRTSSNDKKGEISELNYSDLEAFKVGYSKKFGTKYQNEKIPTLREALELANGKIKVCIEIKVYGVEAAVLEIVNDLGMNNDVIIFSFYYPVLAKIRKLDKNIPTLYLIGKADKLSIDYAKLIEVNAIGVGYGTIVNKAFINFAHSNGIELWKWTVNDDHDMQELIDMGLDGLITNFPNKALQKLSATPNKRD